jgi:hypothetical protein
MVHTTPFRAASAAMLVLILSGCYSYRAVDSAPAGSAIRVGLPIDRPAGAIAAPESVMIEGVLVEDGDSIVLAVETRREYGAYREVVQFDTVSLGADRISSIELKEFSRGRSMALGLTLAGAVTLGAAVAFGLGGGGTTDDLGGPPLPDASVVGAQGAVPNLKLGFNPSSLIRLLFGS